MGGALAHEIGKEHQSLAAHRRPGRLGRHQFVGIGVQHPGRAHLDFAQGVAQPLEGAACKEGHAHQVPLVRNAVTEGVDAQFRIHMDFVGVGEDHARCSQAGKDPSRAHDPGSHGAAGVVGPAADDGRAGPESHLLGHFFRHVAAYVDGFVSGRHEFSRKADGVQHGSRPSPFAYVEQQRARGVGHLHGEFARHPEPYVVLGQHYAPDPFVYPWLMVADPDQFGRGEAFEGGIGHPPHEVFLTRLFRDPAALFGGSRIAPQDGRPEHLVPRVEQHRTVHLSRQADSRDGVGGNSGGAHGFAHRVRSRAPPVRRILFRPVRPGGVQGDLFEGPAYQFAPFIDDDRLDARGTDIDADKVSHTRTVACRGSVSPAQKNLRKIAGT